jgi:formylglycine-generating enzyme required for sulfatase activity
VYRLPSEAEWEYACRAGAITRRHYGHSDELLVEYAWYEGNSENRTWPVGLKKPNDFGLFDMHGNVWTWCHNRDILYGETEADEQDVQSLQDIQGRVLRGGSFNAPARYIRATYRLFHQPVHRANYFGFRLARTYP